MNTRIAARSLAAAGLLATFGGCATATQLASDLNAVAAGAPLSAYRSAASGPVVSGPLSLGSTIQGRIAAADGTSDHEVELQSGQHFNAILSVPRAESSRRRVSLEVYRKNPTTDELQSAYVPGAEVDVRNGVAAATGVVDVTEPGIYVLRVHSSEPGVYAVALQLAEKDQVVLDQATERRIDARDDTDDFALALLPGQHFNVTVSAPFTDEPRRTVGVELYRRNLTTGELSSAYVGGAEVAVRDNRPSATGVVDVKEPGTYVIRVRSAHAGPYTITPRLVEKGSATLGQAVQATTGARDDTDDYVLKAQRGEHFSVVLSAPFTDNPRRRVAVEIYRKDEVTGELSSAYVPGAEVSVRDGKPASTGVVEVKEPGTYVVRVTSNDVGPYSFTAERTTAGSR